MNDLIKGGRGSGRHMTSMHAWSPSHKKKYMKLSEKLDKPMPDKKRDKIQQRMDDIADQYKFKSEVHKGGRGSGRKPSAEQRLKWERHKLRTGKPHPESVDRVKPSPEQRLSSERAKLRMQGGIAASVDSSLDNLIKAGGPGSRGGKVVGHTQSGKPIYDSFNHSSHNDFSNADHADAFALHTHLKNYRQIDDHKNAAGGINAMVSRWPEKGIQGVKQLSHDAVDAHGSSLKKSMPVKSQKFIDELKKRIGQKSMEVPMFNKSIPESLILEVDAKDEDLAKAIKGGLSNESRSKNDSLFKADQSWDLTKAEGESKEDQAAEASVEGDDEKKGTEEDQIEKEQMGKSEIYKGGAGSGRHPSKMRDGEIESEINSGIKANQKSGGGDERLTSLIQERKRRQDGGKREGGVKKSVSDALDSIIKGYGSENLIDNHSESQHPDMDPQAKELLTSIEPINPFDESHNPDPLKVDPSKPGYKQDKSFIIRTV